MDEPYITRPLYEHQDANLHDKLQFVSLQISDELNIWLHIKLPNVTSAGTLAPIKANVLACYLLITNDLCCFYPQNGRLLHINKNYFGSSDI